ncbi:MAG: epoxyqueuosine reductase [Desulfobacterales bacterium]|nr:epoxyqueuosine reductase [Desulfobacterales bacterium]
MKMKIEQQIIRMAVENGATLAGLADVRALKASPSHVIYSQMGDYTGVGTVKDGGGLPVHQLFNWPDSAKFALVIGLAHPKDRPELDWWDGKGTPGNRMLIDIMARTRKRIEADLNIGTQPLHYYVEKGGVFLKDAAVLAGLGCIGRNNLLVTPSCGPRLRLRALFLEAEIDPTGPVSFDPCKDCRVDCRRVCPEKAMNQKAPVFESFGKDTDLPARDGAYDRQICNIRMEKDVAAGRKNTAGEPGPIKYCRRCEFICPVGK